MNGNSCKNCGHSFIEHDDIGCKHTACECKVNATNFMAGNWKADSRLVSIKRQIVYTIIPIVWIWAFYKIKRLQKFFLYVLIPSIIVGFIQGFVFGFLGLSETSIDMAVSVSIGIAFTLFAIYLVVKWSRQWNQEIISQIGS